VPTRAVILSNRTLLLEGVLTRLHQFQDRVELHLVDLQQPNPLAQITTVQPAAIIMDDKDPVVAQAVPLDRLFQALPTVKVIRLDAHCPQTQVIRSEEFWVTEVRDLLELIEPACSEDVG